MKGLSGSAKHIVLPLLTPRINREHLVFREDLSSEHCSPRGGALGAAQHDIFLLLSLLINLKGTSGFTCNTDLIYRAGQGRLLLTKSIVENGTAVHSIITPGT